MDDAPIALRKRFLIEVAVETTDDAVAAAEGGADRLELSAALDLGGLTPSLGAFLDVKAATRLPVVVMIRPRGGDFVYTDAEFRVMARDVDALRPHAPAAFVFGLLTHDAEVDRDRAAALKERCGPVPCVFHRAFDRCRDPIAAADALIEMGFARVLTSGRESTAIGGAALLARLRKHCGDKLGVLPCGRVRADNIKSILSFTKCDQAHGSFAEPVPDDGSKGRKGYAPQSRTSRAEVEAARRAADELGAGGG